MRNKTVIILIFIITFSFLARAEIRLPNQEKVDAALAGFHLLKNKNPQEAENYLKSAAKDSYWTKDIRPTVIIRQALWEYQHTNGWGWTDSTAQWRFLDGLSELYAKHFKDNQSYGRAVLETTAALRFLDYCQPDFIPFSLVRANLILETMPPYSPEPDLRPYYDLLPFMIDGKNHKALHSQVKTKLKRFTPDAWLYAGFRAILEKQPQKVIDRIIAELRNIDPAGADALQAYGLEKRGNLSDEEVAVMKNLYAASAAKGNVLGCGHHADHQLPTDPGKALEILKPVENHKYFSVMAGTLIKGVALMMHSNEEKDLREAARLIKDAEENCYDGAYRKYSKKYYAMCMNKLTVLELEEMERNLDPEESTVADLKALAKGYESIEGYEKKAIKYYAQAADAGDLDALCRMCVYVMQLGIAEENEEKIRWSALNILKHAKSDWLPFRLNAAFVLIYNLQGLEFSKKDVLKGIKYFNDFRVKYHKDPKKSLYVPEHFLYITTLDNYANPLEELPDEDEDEDDYFYDYEDAMKMYYSGLKNEKDGNYEKAKYDYSKAADAMHPFGKWKKELMIQKKNAKGAEAK